MRRSAVAAGICIAVIAATGAGWTAASRVQSPAQLAAKTAAPTPSLITFPVERRVLSSDLIVRGIVRYSDPIAVSLPPSLLRPGLPLISAPPLKGTVLNEGDVALVVSGRPVFVAKGTTPGYRDIGPGATGEDVRQLEAMLKRKGFDPGVVDGVFDSASSRAVARWYQSAGYTAFGPTEAQQTALRQAGTAVSQATDRLLLARQSELVNRKGVKPADIADAKAAIAAADAAIVSAQSVVERDAFKGQSDIASKQSAIESAQVVLEDARRRSALAASGRNVVTGLGSSTPAQIAQLELALNDADAGVTAAEADQASSQAIADNVKKAGEAAVVDAKAKVAAASIAVGELTQQQLLDLTNASRTAMSTLLAVEATATKDNSVAAADVVAKSNAVTLARSKVTQAQRVLAVAKTGVDPVSGVPAATPGDQAALATALRQSEIVLVGLTSDLEALKRTVALIETANQQALRDSKARAAAARARLVALSTPGVGGATLLQAVKVAEAEVNRLTAELAKVSKGVGIQIPANELVFFPKLPLRIDDTKVKRGDPASAEVMTVSGTRLAVDSALLTTEARLTKLDAAVSIESPEFAYESAGHVSFIADKPGLRNTDAQHIAIELTPDDAPLQLVGASVRITIPTKTTNGAALVVPISALSVRADGSTQLQVQSSSGTVSTVIVTPGLSAQGFVEVVPLEGTLVEGARVVIGTKGASSASTPATNVSTPGVASVPTDSSASTASTPLVTEPGTGLEFTSTTVIGRGNGA